MYFLISLGAIITSAILFCENNNIVVSRVKINKKVKNTYITSKIFIFIIPYNL